MIHYFAIAQFADKYGACPAISFATPDLGAGEVLAVTDKIEQGHACRLLRGDRFIV
jgi:hypothetical protein